MLCCNFLWVGLQRCLRGDGSGAKLCSAEHTRGVRSASSFPFQCSLEDKRPGKASLGEARTSRGGEQAHFQGSANSTAVPRMLFENMLFQPLPFAQGPWVPVRRLSSQA